jgi:peptidyl-dipeptidase Dcp
MRCLNLFIYAIVCAGAEGASSGSGGGGGGNPLLGESSLPYHLPPFDQIKDEHFAHAFEKGMAGELAEIEKIAHSRSKPTFHNTIVALERGGQLLNRARRAFGILNASLTNPALQKLDADFSPRFAAHEDAIALNPALFARIRTLYEARSKLKLDPESRRLLEKYYEDFERSGASLPEAGKARLKAINSELAALSTKFRQNVLKETNASAVAVSSRDELAGLPEAQVAAAAGPDGKLSIRLTNTTGQPPLDSLQNAAVRQRVMAASQARGSRGGEFDNRAVVSGMARLRAERAQLLGHANYASYRLKEQTAGTVEAVNKLLARIAPAAVANARKEAAELRNLAGNGNGSAEITAADWAFYAEKLRLSRYAFDESQLRPYYEIRRVLVDGVFHAATKLYGITFKERADLKGYSPDMFVFEVFNADGSALGLFLGDFYARPNKRGGAWASAYVPQSTLLGTKPVIGNHLNIPKPPAGEPTLLTQDEVTTMFHEFGHALHGLFSAVKYPRFSGTSVPRDFVEFPSQVNEMWATWPEVLANFAIHYQTGKPMPKELLDKVRVTEAFQQGYKTTELVAAAILDQAWHQLKPDEVPTDVAAFEEAVLKKHGLDFAPVPPRYRSTYFSHVFAGGYAAGYYSYLWSEVLDADAVEWFKQNGGLKRANGDRFRATLLSRGDSRDAMQMYRDFRGSDPDPEPFLRRRGLAQ